MLLKEFFLDVSRGVAFKSSGIATLITAAHGVD